MNERAPDSTNPAVGLDGRVVAQILHHIAVSTYHLRVYGVENSNVLQSIDIVVSSVDYLTRTVPLGFEFQDGQQKGFDIQSAKVWVNGTVFEPKPKNRLGLKVWFGSPKNRGGQN